jgi:hypothetical protein
LTATLGQWLRWEEGDIRNGWKTDGEDGRMKDIGKTGGGWIYEGKRASRWSLAMMRGV